MTIQKKYNEMQQKINRRKKFQKVQIFKRFSQTEGQIGKKGIDFTM